MLVLLLFISLVGQKGSHAAIKSGMLAADAIMDDVFSNETATEAVSYYPKFRSSWLYEVPTIIYI